MVDLTRDQHGCLHARLLDVVPGRSGTAYSAWLRGQTAEFVDGVEHAALDPFGGYANATRDELPDAVAVLDAFHVARAHREDPSPRPWIQNLPPTSDYASCSSHPVPPYRPRIDPKSQQTGG